MITNPKQLEPVVGTIQKAINAIGRSLESRRINLRIVHGLLSEEEFKLEVLRGGDLDKLNKARQKKDLYQIQESNNFQTLSADWTAIQTGNAVVVSPCFGQRPILSNAQIDEQIEVICSPGKLEVTRLDNDQNTVYFISLPGKDQSEKPKSKKPGRKKSESKNENDV